MSRDTYVTSVVHSFEDEIEVIHTLREFKKLSPALQWGILQFLDTPRSWTWDFDVTLDLTCYPGDPGVLNALPENCYPPEDPYAEVQVAQKEWQRWMRHSVTQLHASLWMLYDWIDKFYVWELFEVIMEKGIENVDKNYQELVDFPSREDYY